MLLYSIKSVKNYLTEQTLGRVIKVMDKINCLHVFSVDIADKNFVKLLNKSKFYGKINLIVILQNTTNLQRSVICS